MGRLRISSASTCLLTIAGALFLCLASSVSARADFPFLPSEPASEFLPVSENAPDHGFCSRWDPEYGYQGKACCSSIKKVTHRKLPKCAPNRIKWTFCDEMTDLQRDYLERAKQGEVDQWLDNRGAQSSQAFCSVSEGFLVNGRPVVPSAKNRLLIRNPNRCTQFGTDGLVGALEWLGREVGREYSTPEKAGIRINVGDLSAPRGGCISGRRGRRGHASHTTGQDADIGFLNVKVGAEPLNAFTIQFDPHANWWLIKKLFSNPYACVKAVFLDKRLIRKLAKAAMGDEMWPRVAHRIQHVRGHRSHLHIRVGHLPGEPGCPRESGWANDEIGPLDEEEDSISPDSGMDPANEDLGQMVRGGAASWDFNAEVKAAPTKSGDALSVSSSAPARPPGLAK